MHQFPGAPAILGGGWQRKQHPAPLAGAYRRLPQFPFLHGGEQQGQPGRGIGIQRILVQPLDESPERQDVGRLPDLKTLRILFFVEFAREFVREALVGRDHDDPPRVAFREP
jgi:hypothetical protein